MGQAGVEDRFLSQHPYCDGDLIMNISMATLLDTNRCFSTVIPS
jgi:hypothetical protein